ncbi:MAG: potassium/proton antiporter [Cardiobacteriaceae bacterium]|nr:potassium/proton antiporter [Cardiobacteriaceae bacterium]
MFEITSSNAIQILYLVCSVLVFLSVLGSMLSARFGLPLLVIFLGVGMLAGEEGMLKIPFSNFFLANLLGQASLAVILLDGGLRTSIQSFRLVFKPAAVLATWGVLATVVILGTFVTWILHFIPALSHIDWRFGFLMAAIIGSTDAGAVFSVLRTSGVRLNERVQATLEIESGANDPMAILLVSALILLNTNPEEQNLSSFILMLLQQMGLGIVMGWVFGRILAGVLPKIRLAEGMYSLLIVSGGTIIFATTNLLGGSGFLAIYLAGLVIGNRKTRATEHVLQVMDGMAWMAQVVLFVVLGLLVLPSHVLHLAPYALAIWLFMTFVARPLAVFSGLLPFGYRAKEMGFISWVGLRGAVPVTLAIMPVMAGVEYANLLFNLTFGVVILSLLIQGMTVPFMAKRFKVRVPTTYEPRDQREIWVGNRTSIHIFEYVVRKGAFVVGRHPEEIAKRVGEGVRVFAFVRDGMLHPLEKTSNLRGGDSVWYSVDDEKHTESIARAFNDTIIERREKSEFFGEWVVSPQVHLGDLALLDDGSLDALTLSMTVNEYVRASLSVEPVVGDHIKLGMHWLLVVRETDDEGNIMALGLKMVEQKQKKPREA